MQPKSVNDCLRKSAMTDASAWLLFDKSPRQGDLILFCLHHAGGNASVFRAWQERVPGHVAVARVQLPGHGTRLGEPLLTRMDVVVAGLIGAMRPWLDFPYALFGHSMGGIVAAQCTLSLQDEGLPLPAFLVLAACEPIHEAWWEPCHELPSPAFREQIYRLGGTPREVLAEESLMSIMEPVLRADHAVLETWLPRPARPIRVPMHVLHGEEDPIVTRDIAARWKDLAGDSLRVDAVPGNHFFLASHEDIVLSHVLSDIRNSHTRNEQENEA